MRNPWKVTTFVFAIAIAAIIGGKAINSAEAEKQPHMEAALNALRTAEGELKNATADKGGHRAKAIDLVAKAIAETKAGIEFDNANKKK